jgi:protein PET117
MTSLGSKITLAGAFGFAVTITALVHKMQNSDRQRLRQGVERDLERQERKKRNMEELKDQISLQKHLEERDKEPMS